MNTEGIIADIQDKAGSEKSLPGLQFNTYSRFQAEKRFAVTVARCFFCAAQKDVFQCPWCRGVSMCPAHGDIHRRRSKCFPFSVANIQGKGRGLIASRFIREGELVLEDTAALSGPGLMTTPVCPTCLAPSNPESRLCSECSLPVCDAKCQENEVHKVECKLLAANKVKVKIENFTHPSPIHSFIMPYRLLKLKDQDTEAWDRVACLKDHLEERVGLVEFDYFQKDVVQFLRQRCFLSREYSEEEIHRAVGIITVNAADIQPRLFSGPSKGIKGKCIFPVFALLNHSCMSNAKFSIDAQDETPRVRVIARRDIEEGEEINVQYYSSLLGTHKRRRRLKSEWYFNCKCQRCSDRTELSTMVSGVMCEVCELGVLLPKAPLDELSDWTCSECDFLLEVPDLERKIDQLEEEINLLSSRQDVGKLEEFISDVSGSILHPNHYLLLLAHRNKDFIHRKNRISKMTSDNRMRTRQTGNRTGHEDSINQIESKIYQTISKILLCDDK